MPRRYANRATVDGADHALTDRDRSVVRFVSDLRFVSGDQLARAHFIAADPKAQARSARRALIRLVRLDVLARLPRRVGGVRAGSSGFVYHLGAVGHKLAVRHGWQSERKRRRSDVPGTAFLNHSLAVAELHTQLIEAERAGRIELLELSAEPACWRRYGGGTRRAMTLKADSYVRLGLGEYEDSYFLEVDRGTEGSATIERKLREYVVYAAAGVEQADRGVFPRVLWLAPSESRAQVIASSVGRVPKASRELFAVARLDEAVTVMAEAPDNTPST